MLPTSLTTTALLALLAFAALLSVDGGRATTAAGLEREAYLVGLHHRFLDDRNWIDGVAAINLTTGQVTVEESKIPGRFQNDFNDYRNLYHEPSNTFVLVSDSLPALLMVPVTKPSAAFVVNLDEPVFAISLMAEEPTSVLVLTTRDVRGGKGNFITVDMTSYQVTHLANISVQAPYAWDFNNLLTTDGKGNAWTHMAIRRSSTDFDSFFVLLELSSGNVLQMVKSSYGGEYMVYNVDTPGLLYFPIVTGYFVLDTATGNITRSLYTCAGGVGWITNGAMDLATQTAYSMFQCSLGQTLFTIDMKRNTFTSLTKEELRPISNIAVSHV